MGGNETTEITKPICTGHTSRRAKPCAPCSLKNGAARVFTGVDLFALSLTFYLHRVIPINLSWHQKTSDALIPEGEHRVLLRSFVLTQYQECDGLTDGRKDKRMDGYAVAYTGHAKLALWRAVNRNATLEQQKCQILHVQLVKYANILQSRPSSTFMLVYISLTMKSF